MFQCFIIINLVYVINIINAYIECELPNMICDKLI